MLYKIICKDTVVIEVLPETHRDFGNSGDKIKYPEWMVYDITSESDLSYAKGEFNNPKYFVNRVLSNEEQAALSIPGEWVGIEIQLADFEINPNYIPPEEEE